MRKEFKIKVFRLSSSSFQASSSSSSFKYKRTYRLFPIFSTINLISIFLIFCCCYFVHVSSANQNTDTILSDFKTDNNDNGVTIKTGSSPTSNLNDHNYGSSENSDDNVVQLQLHFNKKFTEPILPQSAGALAATTISDTTANESTSLDSSNNSNNNGNGINNNRKKGSAVTATTLGSRPTTIATTSFIATINNSTITATINRRITTPEEYAKTILFKYYKNGQLTYIADGINEETLEQTGCNANDRFAFILHGWRENCDVEWVPLLISKLTQYRGGCIICIDYGFFAQEPYVRLVRQYEPLSHVITEKLRYLRSQGFNPEKGYMFGFSYGGQLACAVGRKLGTRLIKEIDTCDMAGPGFDYKVNRLDHRDAAQNVQCIHTTRDKGTKYYTCHQDWRMGNCGYSQPAAQEPPKGSHGLCPYFYINAFEYAFYAIKRPDKCISRKPASFWPDGYKMGYMESRKNQVNGELFAYTGEQYPFNVAINSNPNSYDNDNQNINVNAYDLHYPPQAFIFYNQPQIPNFRDRPVLNSIMRARKFIRRLQRNLRNQLI